MTNSNDFESSSHQGSVSEVTQVLSFRFGEALFALPVSQVQEIVPRSQVTRVPQASAFMPGVMNLRGLVLPILDLSRLFGLNAIQDTVDSCIVVVEAPLAEETTSVGLLCDGVREVLTLKPEQVEPPPSYGAAVSKHFLSGIAKVEDQLIMLLELRQIFAGILAQHAS